VKAVSRGMIQEDSGSKLRSRDMDRGLRLTRSIFVWKICIDCCVFVCFSFSFCFCVYFYFLLLFFVVPYFVTCLLYMGVDAREEGFSPSGWCIHQRGGD
jgi:hypothetical protein